MLSDTCRFLDDYYSQFENRVDRKGVLPAHDSDATASRHSGVQQSSWPGAATGYNVAVAVPSPDLVQSQRRQDGGPPQLQLTDE